MINIKTKIKAIIFDMDGTIIKTEHIWQQVTTGTLAKYGIHQIPEDKLAFVNNLAGMGLKEASHAIKEEFGLPDTVEEIINLKLALANMHFESRLEYIDGFEEFHKKLAANNIPSGIATNAHPTNLNEIVKTMNFTEKFGENIYCIAHVGFKAKPDPALFLHTAKQLGANPQDCVVFEDSIHGFKAAKAAGMKCIAVKNERNASLLVELTDQSIESYHEAEEALRKI